MRKLEAQDIKIEIQQENKKYAYIFKQVMRDGYPDVNVWRYIDGEGSYLLSREQWVLEGSLIDRAFEKYLEARIVNLKAKNSISALEALAEILINDNLGNDNLDVYLEAFAQRDFYGDIDNPVKGKILEANITFCFSDEEDLFFQIDADELNALNGDLFCAIEQNGDHDYDIYFYDECR